MEGLDMSEIVKVQIPLGGPGPALIYDKAQKYSVMRNLTRDEEKAMGDDVKAYFKASWSSVVGWGLSQRVEDQDW